MTRRLIFLLLLGLHLSVSGQEQPVHIVSKVRNGIYTIFLSGADTIKNDLSFLPRARGDSLVRPVMKEIKTLLDSTCPDKSDRLTFSIFVTYNRSGDVKSIAYLIEKDDIDCFNDDIYVGIYNAFVNISRSLPMAALIDAYWIRLPYERKTGHTMLTFRYNSKTPRRY